MTTVFENKFMVMEYSEDLKFMHHYWLAESSMMQDSDYQESMLAFARIITLHCPVKMLSDTRNLHFLISVDLQEWGASNPEIFEIRKNVSYVAVLVSSKIFVEVSVQQAIEEANNEETLIAYFDDKQKAQTWLDSFKI